MPAEVTETTQTPATADKAGVLRRFLQAYWLRPENAFWMALRSEVLSTCPIEGPALDIACGDGLFSFLHCGGVLDPTFDVFRAVSDVSPESAAHVDMFDRCDPVYQPAVTKTPSTNFTVGVDHKPALLAKAAVLEFYDRLVTHDCNEPLPMDHAAFQTVYCNAAYWIDNVSGFLAELKRITRPDGRIVLQVKLDAMARYTLAPFRKQLGTRFLDIIDRGRLACWRSLTNRTTWEQRFSQADLVVEQATPFITSTHARIWDVGLRPLAPMLIKLANAADDRTRTAVKREWVDLFMELAIPICDAGLDLFDQGGEPAEIQYVLRPR